MVSIPKRVSEFLKHRLFQVVRRSPIVSIPKRVSEFLKPSTDNDPIIPNLFQSLKGFQSF